MESDNSNVGFTHVPFTTFNKTRERNITVSDLTQSESVYFSLEFTIIASTLALIIFLVGIIGNTMVIFVVVRTRSMHTPTNCYLISLAMADCILLLSGTLPAILEPFFEINHWPFGRAMCSILIFLQYLGIDTSSLSITAFTVERFIAICHPMKAQTMCTISRAKRIIAGLWIFGVLYCSPWLGLTHLKRGEKPEFEQCVYRLGRNEYMIYYLTDLCLFYIAPLVIAIVLYSLISWILFVNTLSRSPNGSTGGRVEAGNKPPYRNKKQISSRIQVVKMLIVIVFVFATMWLPYRVMVVYNSFADQKYMNLWFLLFCRTMVYINSAINPILYNAMSMKFRRAFRRVLLCGSHSTDLQSAVFSDVAPDLIPKRPSENSASYVMMSRKNTPKSVEIRIAQNMSSL